MKSELIVNREKAKQLLAFDGMQYGRCRPTDIDFSFDVGGKVFVFGEVKTYGKDLTVGQRLHLQFLCDALAAGGKQAIALFATHSTPNADHDVRVAECDVKKVYFGGSKGKWAKVENQNVDNYLKEYLK